MSDCLIFINTQRENWSVTQTEEPNWGCLRPKCAGIILIYEKGSKRMEKITNYNLLFPKYQSNQIWEGGIHEGNDKCIQHFSQNSRREYLGDLGIDEKLMKQVLRRTNGLLSFYCILSIWYNMDRTEIMVSSSSISAYVFIAAGKHLPSSCLLTAVSSGSIISAFRRQGGQTAIWSHNPFNFYSNIERHRRNGCKLDGSDSGWIAVAVPYE